MIFDRPSLLIPSRRRTLTTCDPWIRDRGGVTTSGHGRNRRQRRGGEPDPGRAPQPTGGAPIGTSLFPDGSPSSAVSMPAPAAPAQGAETSTPDHHGHADAQAPPGHASTSGPRDNPTITPALELIGAQGPDELAADGYVLAGGRADGSVAVLAGRDARGTYYAVQTLRQLLDGAATIPNVQVRDEPLMEIRGAIEGFYGIPWSHRSRLDHFAFYGEHKLNTYIYTPKDDLLLRAKWRDLYEGEELEKLGELVEEATAHHVTFTYALSPGNDITYAAATPISGDRRQVRSAARPRGHKLLHRARRHPHRHGR